MKKTILFIAFLMMVKAVAAMDIYDEIAFAIRSGDAKQLATYFNNSIDLTIMDREDVYSKAQAELVVKDFFSKNPPKSFNVIHKGASPEGTQYAIGNLTTGNGKAFRISFYIKSVGGKNIIQELRIEVQ